MRDRLRTFAAWFWKEWRDQRAVTIGILLAIPGLTALAFWSFGEHLATVWLHNTRAVFLGIGVGLVNFAIASSLFAGETRRGTIQTVRRLPGALGAAFFAKIAFLTVLLVVVIAWSGICLAIAEAGNGGVASDLGLRYGTPGGATRAMALWNQLAEFPTGELWSVGLGMGVLCLWTLLVSTWMGRSGVAGVAAIVLLGVLATPFALMFLAHRYFFAGPWVLAGWTAGISAAAALVACALSHLRGHRFAGRPLRPFLLGSAVLLVALGGGYAYAQVALDDWLEVDPHDDDFQVYEARVGAGERYLYLTVHRGAAWIGDKNIRTNDRKTGWDSVRGTPLQAWVYDLETSQVQKLGGRAAQYFTVVPEAMGTGAFRQLEPCQSVICVRMQDAVENPGPVTWWDAVAASPKRTLPWATRDPVSLDLVRRTLAASSWKRDAQGRRVWLRDDILETEGALEDVPAGVRPRAVRRRALRPVPGGWFGWDMQLGNRMEAKLFLSAADGEQRKLAPDRSVGPWGHYVLGAEYALGFGRSTKKTKSGAREFERIVIPLNGGEAFAPQNLPEKQSSVLGENLVLGLRGPKGAYGLHAWNPIDGADRAIAWSGTAPGPVSSAMVYGRAGDGRMLLMLQRTDPWRTAWAVLTPDARTATLIVPWNAQWRSSAPIALLPDNTLIVGEEHKRVVRYAPGKAREVLFPR